MSDNDIFKAKLDRILSTYGVDIEKAKHYEMVKVERDGKVFYQRRLIGTDQVEEQANIGKKKEVTEKPTTDLDVEDIVSSADLGLDIKKYSDKALLITGETLANLELLRSIKEKLGIGSWNKTLNGWFFPNSAKETIFGMIAEKMNTSTYEGEVQKEQAIELKNSLDVGTPIEVEGKKVEVEEVGIGENGKTEYTTTEGEKVDEQTIAIPPATDEKAVELINDVTPETRTSVGKELLGKDEGEKSEADEIEERNRQNKQKAELKEITTRSGDVVNALDYSFVNDADVQLVSQESILDVDPPYWLPKINEKKFAGYKNKNFVFDYVQLDGNKILLAVNGMLDDSYDSKNEQDNKESDFAVVSIDVLVATQDYYQKKKKAELAKEKEEGIKRALDRVANWSDDVMEKYYPFSYERRLSDKQKKKYTKEQWESLSKEEKIQEIPNMKHPAISLPSSSRISQLNENTMRHSHFLMFKKFVDKGYRTPMDKKERYFKMDDPCVLEYKEIRDLIQWRKNDLDIQREENAGSYKKALETSYGDTNLNNDLLDTHGVKIKLQNGKDIKANHTEQIKSELNNIYGIFGDRSSMSRNFGLKISHAGEKLMFARKALGIYIPSMKAIGVSDRQIEGKFGFTLAHEFSHFMDNQVGKSQGRNYGSDNPYSTAGKIANEFRKNMNKSSDSKYINRSCECFARALEQHYAMQTEGEDAVKYKHIGKAYHEDENHVSKEKYNTIIKPLIEQFLKENDSVMKSLFDKLDIGIMNLRNI